MQCSSALISWGKNIERIQSNTFFPSNGKWLNSGRGVTHELCLYSTIYFRHRVTAAGLKNPITNKQNQVNTSEPANAEEFSGWNSFAASRSALTQCRAQCIRRLKRCFFAAISCLRKAPISRLRLSAHSWIPIPSESVASRSWQ